MFSLILSSSASGELVAVRLARARLEAELARGAAEFVQQATILSRFTISAQTISRSVGSLRLKFANGAQRMRVAVWLGRTTRELACFAFLAMGALSLRHFRVAVFPCSTRFAAQGVAAPFFRRPRAQRTQLAQCFPPAVLVSPRCAQAARFDYCLAVWMGASRLAHCAVLATISWLARTAPRPVRV